MTTVTLTQQEVTLVRKALKEMMYRDMFNGVSDAIIGQIAKTRAKFDVKENIAVQSQNISIDKNP